MNNEQPAATSAIHSASSIHAQCTQTPPGADLIVFNARIVTGNLAQPEAAAFAVKTGRIYSVGADDEILGLKSSSTRIIDARGRRLIPGINDAHMPLLNEANYTYNVRGDGVPTLARALTMLEEQAQRTPEGHWVKVMGGWSPYQFVENRFPSMEELREAVPNRPLHVQYAYNRVFLNTLAMEAFGVGTDRFPDFQVIEFEKDDKGNHTGVVYGDTFGFLALETLVLAVIGAGMAGLACARFLADTGIGVTVFEKSRRLGGRLATRRAGALQFDHGALYVTARSDDFRAYLNACIAAGAAALWTPSGRTDEAADWIAGAPEMSGLTRPLAKGLSIVHDVQIAFITREGQGYSLGAGDGARYGPFDGVVVTAPAPQTLKLLGPVDPAFAALDAVRMSPCWRRW